MSFCFFFKREALPCAVVFDGHVLFLYVQIQYGFEEFAPLHTKIAEKCVVKQAIEFIWFEDFLARDLPFGPLVRPIFIAWIMIEEIDIDGAGELLEDFEEERRHGADTEERNRRKWRGGIFDNGANLCIGHRKEADDGFRLRDERLAVHDAEPVPKLKLPLEFLWHKCPCLRKMQLVRKERLVVEKQAGKLGGQLVTAEFRALFRIDRRIKILFEDGKFVQTVV